MYRTSCSAYHRCAFVTIVLARFLFMPSLGVRLKRMAKSKQTMTKTTKVTERDVSEYAQSSMKELSVIQSGCGLFSQPYGMVSCPKNWLTLLHYNRKMTNLGTKYISDATNGALVASDMAKVPALMKDVNKGLHKKYMDALIGNVVTVALTLDNNGFFRTEFSMIWTTRKLFTSIGEGERCLYYLGMKYAREALKKEIKNPTWFVETFPNCDRVVDDILATSQIPPSNTTLAPAYRSANLLGMTWEDSFGITNDEDLAEMWANVTSSSPTCFLRVTKDGYWDPSLVSVKRGFVSYKSSKECERIWPRAYRGNASRNQEERRLSIDLIINSRFKVDTYLETVRPELANVPNALAMTPMTCSELITDFRVFVFCTPDKKAGEGFKVAIDDHTTRLASAKTLSNIFATTTKLVALGYQSGQTISTLSPEEKALVDNTVITRGPAAVNEGDLEVISLLEVKEHMAEAVSLIERDENHENARASLTKALNLVDQHQSLQTHLSRMRLVGEISLGTVCAGGGGTLVTLLLIWACSQGESAGCIGLLIEALEGAL